jgi:hypothetical protein
MERFTLQQQEVLCWNNLFKGLHTHISYITLTWASTHLSFQGTDDAMMTLIRLQLSPEGGTGGPFPQVDLSMSQWFSLLDCLRDTMLMGGSAEFQMKADRMVITTERITAFIPFFDRNTELLDIPDQPPGTPYTVNKNGFLSALRHIGRLVPASHKVVMDLFNNHLILRASDECGTEGKIRCDVVSDLSPMDGLMDGTSSAYSRSMLVWLASRVPGESLLLRCDVKQPLNVMAGTTSSRARFEGFLAPYVPNE